MITIDNYEGYLMRYADGELSDDEVAMVEAFLAAHPDLRDELEAITDPSLKITPPLVYMPGKEEMMQPVAAVGSHKAVWKNLAAAIALLMAIGIVLKIGPRSENPIVAQIGGVQPLSVTDSPLPDSLYIGRGKPAPLLLAHKGNAKEYVAMNDSPSQNLLPEVVSDDDGIVFPVNETEEQLLAQNDFSDSNVSEESSNKRRNGNVIIIETDQLVTLTPKPAERHDLRVGSVVENNNLALAEEKGLLGKAFDAVSRFIMRRNGNEIETTLAFSE